MNKEEITLEEWKQKFTENVLDKFVADFIHDHIVLPFKHPLKRYMDEWNEEFEEWLKELNE